MTVRAITYKGKLIDSKAMRRAISNGLAACAKGAKVDFQVTTQTWKKRPDFVILKVAPLTIEVSTDNEVFIYVDEGTPPHEIRPKNGKVLVFNGSFKPKTRVRVVASGAGSSGPPKIVTMKPVQHPGTEAREFSDVIHEKWEKRAPELLQRFIDQAVK